LFLFTSFTLVDKSKICQCDAANTAKLQLATSVIYNRAF
jgi:hypothetical protein